MRLIAHVRQGLTSIPGALVNVSPEPTDAGYEPAVPEFDTIWAADNWDTAGDDQNPNVEPEDENEPDRGDSVPDLEPVFELGADADATTPALGGPAAEAIWQSVQARGMDALGWYASFHVRGRQWGIYVSESGMAYMAEQAFGDLKASQTEKTRLAFHAILNHELFHFASDCAVAQAELACEEAWWVPAKKALVGGTPSYCVAEEKLANAYMLKAFKTARPGLRFSRKQAALKAFTKKQPEGYRDGWTVGAKDWDGELRLLAWEYGRHGTRSAANRRLWDPRTGYDWPRHFPLHPKIDWRYCPIHLIRDGQRYGLPPGWITFFDRIAQLRMAPAFERKLLTLAAPIQQAWWSQRTRLERALTPGADFKRWKPGGPDIYSVRINDGYRAHIRYERPAGGWIAVDIGSHKDMGHG